MERRNITRETRGRNLLYRSKTHRKICDYIYEHTNCERCRVGRFCSRDGDKWGCLSYNNIAEHLNHIRWPSSRGNVGKWSIKTVRDQITRGLREKSLQEKRAQIEELNKHRNENFVWETHELTEGTEEQLQVISEFNEDSFGSVVVGVGSDVDVFLDNLRKTISTYHARGIDVAILHVPRDATEDE